MRIDKIGVEPLLSQPFHGTYPGLRECQGGQTHTHFRHRQKTGMIYCQAGSFLLQRYGSHAAIAPENLSFQGEKGDRGNHPAVDRKVLDQMPQPVFNKNAKRRLLLIWKKARKQYCF
ncbi:hypothetical protein [Eilatimonas milleporae]|uniref:hypothetical protein n=1 Tax=Eilatimonas milleporae TaxID=911205 RepID=UPI001FE302E1|nr:hypothetical protein [Eilatimonas milleporae]